MNALEYVLELVRFESVSSQSNLAVSDHVHDVLRRLDFEVERLEYDDARGVRKANLVARKGPGRGGMAYFCHTDTVPADNWQFTEHGPFDPFVDGDRVYGRGSCDMKGSLACMLAAAEQVSLEQLTEPIYITCTADEEVGYVGAAQVAKSSSLFQQMVGGHSRGIIGEPTLLNVVHGHKGTYGFVATSHGRAAHSSTAAGLNANLAMIPFLMEMKSIHDETEADPVWQNPEFDPPGISWNIGINDHNRAVNITAERSVCTVYFRPMPDQDGEILLERAREAAERNGLEFQVLGRGEPMYVDPQSAFVREVLQLAEKASSRTVSYGTDGAMFGELENLLVCGPGDIAQAHTTDEWIALDQLTEGTKLYARMIDHWCCS